MAVRQPITGYINSIQTLEGLETDRLLVIEILGHTEQLKLDYHIALRLRDVLDDSLQALKQTNANGVAST